MRRAFTLIELLVIVGIIAAMISVSVVSVRAGQDSARIKGATRDIFAAIRHARSVALVTQQPAVITYATERIDGEVVARVNVTSAKLMNTETDRSQIESLTGEPIDWGDAAEPAGESYELVHVEREGEASAAASTQGETVEETLFAPKGEDVVRGVRLKVLKGDEELEQTGGVERPRNKISIFSNVDYLLERFSDARQKAEEERKAAEQSEETAAVTEELQPKVDLVWEVNGRVEPHRVWVYLDGTEPDDGYCISIDRYGAAKVLSDGEDE